MNTSARLGGQSALILLGNVMTLLIGLPLQIYLSRVLGADGLGMFGLLESTMGVVAGLVAFGVAATLVKYIPAYLELRRYGSLRALVLRGARLLLVSGVASYVALLVALPLATRAWPALVDLHIEIVVMGLVIPLSLFAYFFQQGLRGFQDVLHIVLGSSVVQLVVKAALAVALLSLGFHLLGYVVATVLSLFCACIWTGTVLWRRLSALPASGDEAPYEVTEWRSFATVQYGASVLGLAAQYLDRFLLGAFAGASPVGILMVVKQLQQMPVIFLQVFLAVAAPMFSSAHARDDSAELAHIYHLTTDWVVRLSAPLFAFFVFFADPLLLLYGPNFLSEGKQVLWILLGSQAFNLLIGPVGNALNMTGSESLMLRFGFIGMVLSVCGLVLVVPTHGLTGVAWVIAIQTIFMNVAAFHAARRKLGLRWMDRRYLGWILPMAISSLAGFAMASFGPQTPGAVVLVADLVGLYAVFHGVSIAQGLHEDDRKLLAHLRSKLGFTG